MNRKYTRQLSIGLAVLGATACGGSSGTADLKIGVFLDSPVANLSYTTATVNGVTNADGEFQYREGEIVVFSIGGLTLPMVVGAPTVTPLDMASTDALHDSAVVNITRLLQTLDEDSDPSNGITIPKIADEQLADTVILDVEDSDVVDTIVQQVFMGERELVSTDDAISHFVETLSIAAKSEGSLEKRQFLVNEEQGFSGDTIFIGSDSFALQTAAGNFSGAWQEINGVYQLQSEETTWFLSVSESDNEVTACIAASPQPVDACDGERYVVFDDVNQASLYEPRLIDSMEGAAKKGEEIENEVVEVADQIVDGGDSQRTDENLEVGAAQESERAEETSGSTPAEPATAAPEPEPSTNEQIENVSEPTLTELFPACDPGTVDDNGDGYGWQDYQSCLIVAVPEVALPAAESPTIDIVPTSPPVSTAPTNVTTPVTEEASVGTPEEAGAVAPDEAVIPEVVEQTDSSAVAETVADNPDIPSVAAILPPIVIVDVPTIEEEPQAIVALTPQVEETAVTEMPTQEPVSITEPATDGPVEIEPVVTEPVVTEPVVTEPVVTEPAVTEPAVTEPVVTEPVVNEPVVNEPVVTEPVVSEPVVIEPVQVDNSLQPSDITDLIILTGQSNATATETAYDSLLDAGHERVFAFGDDLQWREADLQQNWDAHFPGNYSQDNPDRDPYNNLVFQMGKSIANKSDRVVGVIMITAPGEGISHWDYGSEFYNRVRTRAIAALDELPNKSSLDAMIWMQGETDWLYEGTADPEATGFSSITSDFYKNYYPNKLSQLISNLRSEWWFGANAKFICGETKNASLNPHLMALNDDGDPKTACAQAADLPTRLSDPYHNHYSSEGLRTLGARMADIYLAED